VSPLALPGYLRDTLLRFLPHRARTGLRRIGDPGPDDPVLLTGNFALTVRRLQETLRASGTDQIEVSTGRDYVRDLVGFFRTRERRQARRIR